MGISDGGIFMAAILLVLIIAVVCIYFGRRSDDL